MKTIKENVTSELTIKNSRFIAIIYKVNNLHMIKPILKEIKEAYKDATHYCYAYIIDKEEKSSDDGEPSGTAGIPILQVLKKNDLNYVIGIVVRYFGGIKLGAGGLVRAYAKSITNVLEKSIILNLVEGYNITISFTYDNLKDIDYLFKDCMIIKKSFNEKVEYNLDISNDLLIKIKNNTKINIITITNKYIISK
jgi:uncharacterized YigZ family protein